MALARPPGAATQPWEMRCLHYLEDLKAVDVQNADVILLVALLHCFVDSLGRDQKDGGGGMSERKGADPPTPTPAYSTLFIPACH